MPQITIRKGSREIGNFSFSKHDVTIGRAYTNDIFLEDEEKKITSHYHAAIMFDEEEGFLIWDLGSKNKTYLNGERVIRERLKDKDEISIGDYSLIFHADRVAQGKKLIKQPQIKESSRIETSINTETKRISFKLIPEDFTKLHEAHQKLFLLYKIDKIISSTLDFEELFERAIRVIFETFKTAERGFIALAKRERPSNLGDFDIKVVQNNTPEEELEVSRTIISYVCHKKRPILTTDALADGRFRKGEEISDSIVRLNIKSAICVPLLKQEKFIGLVYLDNRISVGCFSEDDLYFLTILSNQMAMAIENARLHKEVREENERFYQNLKPRIIGRSPKMKYLYEQINRVSKSNSLILLKGENGTGKTLVAKAIHKMSSRSDKAFVNVNCSNFPKSIAESELFGVIPNYPGFHHPEGMIGKFEQADGGTLFLDEIGDMDLDVQAKVLKAIEEKEITELGGNKSIPVDIRIIVATNKDLWSEVKKGNFREDLYHRVAVIELEIPPLRERKEDIPLLAHYILDKKRKEIGGVRTSEISHEVIKLFLAYDWPGNIRELENCIERAIVLGSGRVISEEDIRDDIKREIKTTLGSFPALEQMVSQTEKEHILKALEFTNGNQSKAAKILGIARDTLTAKMDRHGIERAGMTILSSKG